MHISVCTSILYFNLKITIKYFKSTISVGNNFGSKKNLVNSDLNQRGIYYLFNKEMGGLIIYFAAQGHPNNPGSFLSIFSV